MNKFFLLITTIFFITLFNIPKIALINETEPRQLAIAIQKHHKKQKVSQPKPYLSRLQAQFTLQKPIKNFFIAN
jgi:hypothetical protein